jgi:hypothetical protein
MMTSSLNDRAFEQSTFSGTRSKKSVGQSSTEPRKYQYKTLMQVDVFNTFYNESGDRCADFRIYPTATTQSMMKSLGLLFREQSTGFSVLYNDCREEGLIQYLRKHGSEANGGQTEYWSKLSFIVALHNPLFVNFTDLPFNLDLTARNVYLSNNLAHLDNDEIILNENSYVSSWHGNFIEVIPAKYAVPFTIEVARQTIDATEIKVTSISGEIVFHVTRKAAVDMAYLNFAAVPEGRYTISWLTGTDVVFQNPVIYTTAYPTPLCFIDLLFSRPAKDAQGIYPVKLDAEKSTITSVLYHLKFKARDIHWVYWIVSSSQPVENMRIKAEGDSNIHFYGPIQGLIPTGETAWSFVSDRVIPLQERSPLRFKLVDRLNCRCESSCDCKSRMIVNPLPLISSNQVLNASLAGFLSADTLRDSKKNKYSEVYVYV